MDNSLHAQDTRSVPPHTSLSPLIRGISTRNDENRGKKLRGGGGGGEVLLCRTLKKEEMCVWTKAGAAGGEWTVAVSWNNDHCPSCLLFQRNSVSFYTFEQQPYFMSFRCAGAGRSQVTHHHITAAVWFRSGKEMNGLKKKTTVWVKISYFICVVKS